MSPQLFVGNIPFNATEDDIYRVFQEFEVVDILLHRREDGSSKGTAMVTFSSPNAASTALEAREGAEMMGRPLRLRLAEPHPPRMHDMPPRGPPRGRGPPPVAKVDRSQPRWWESLHLPSKPPAKDENGIPSVIPVGLFKVVGGTRQSRFLPCNIAPKMLHSEARNDVERRGFVPCMLHPVEELSQDRLQQDENLELLDGVMKVFQEALNYDANVNASFKFGVSIFIVPPPLVGEEEFSVSELREIVSEGVVHHVHVDRVPLNEHATLRKDVLQYFAERERWSYKGTSTSIDVVFKDHLIALFRMTADGKITPDTDAAAAAHFGSPEAFLVGDELQQRADYCKLDGHRLKTPNDVRLGVPIEHQITREVDEFHDLDGWRASSIVVSDIAHGSRSSRAPTKHSEFVLSRRHLRSDLNELDGPIAGSYTVYKADFICVGKQHSFQLILSEVPPSESEDTSRKGTTTSPDDMTVVLLEGLHCALGVANDLANIDP